MIDDGSPSTISDFPMAENDARIALEAFSQGIFRSLQICFPACVYSYDRSNHTAEVMPLVKQAFYNGAWNYIRRKPFKVTVRNIQCGGFTIDIPVFVGDTGWVFSSDRDTLLVKQEGSLTNSVLEKDRPIAIVEDDYQQKPHQPILHDFSRGFFIPDNWGGWETNRYKDNPEIAVANGLYIGSSMDTNDNRNDTKDKIYQKGDGYEKKTTSSIVLNSGGGVTVASSSDTVTSQNAHMTVEKNKFSAEANDLKNKFSSAMTVDAETGILIRQDVEDKEQHFVCTVKPGSFFLRMVDGEKMLNFCFEDGKLNVSTSSDVNMRVGGDTSFRCEGNVNVTGEKDMNVHAEGNVNVRAAKDANISATNARIVAEESASVAAKNVSVAAAETANVNAGKTVNIGSTETTNINSGQEVNLAAGKEINITAPDTVNVVTANNATVMAKKKGAKVLVTTLSKDSTIDVIAEGKNSKMNVTFKKKESAVNLTMQEEKSTVDIVTEKGDSPISVTTKGDRSDITLAAKGSKVVIEAKENIEVSSQKDVNVNAYKNVNIGASSEVNVSAPKVNINGETRVNGKILTPSVHGPDDSVKYWAHD